MLLSLHVRDLALIESAELTFAPGLNVISGETGGGKSLVVTALKLLRGERANAGLVRHGASALRVDGEFTLAGGDDGDTPTTRRRAQAVREWLAAELGEAPSGDVLLVTRIVDLAGRSRVRIDDRPATLATLRALGQHLIEIHGQDDSRCLMRPELQAETLDAWAGEGAVAARDRFAAALRAARAAQRRLDDVRGDESQRAERVALLRDRLLAMEGLALQPGRSRRSRTSTACSRTPTTSASCSRRCWPTCATTTTAPVRAWRGRCAAWTRRPGSTPGCRTPRAPCATPRCTSTTRCGRRAAASMGSSSIPSGWARSSSVWPRCAMACAAMGRPKRPGCAAWTPRGPSWPS